MNFRLATDRDQALLAMVIKEAGAAAQEQNRFLGRTAVQKIMYFLKTSGVEMDYKFDVHHYGPFCSEIMSDMEYLVADGAVIDTSKEERYSNYRSTAGADVLIEEHQGQIRQYEAKVRKIARMLAPKSPKELEFYSTLDYVYRWVKATGVESPMQDRVIERFLHVKPDVFPESQIRDAYRRMVDVGAFLA